MMSQQRRDGGEAPPKLPDKPIDVPVLPPDYGTSKEPKTKRS